MSDPTPLDTNPLAVALAHGLTHAEAGALVGISARTVRRRLASNPALREAIRAERQVLAQQVADLLTAQAEAAIARLGQVIADGADRDATAAARVVLDQAVRHRDAVYVSDRLADIEQTLRLRQEEAS